MVEKQAICMRGMSQRSIRRRLIAKSTKAAFKHHIHKFKSSNFNFFPFT